MNKKRRFRYKFNTLILLWVSGSTLFGAWFPFPNFFDTFFPGYGELGEAITESTDFSSFVNELVLAEVTPATEFTLIATATADPTETVAPTETRPFLPTNTPQPPAPSQPTSTPTSSPTLTSTPPPTTTTVPTAVNPPTATPTFDWQNPCSNDSNIGFEQDGKWVVAPCASMSAIAGHLGIHVGELIDANPQIENPSLILPGTLLNLP